MKLIMEIRSAEGGEHAKLLVHKQRDIYKNYALKHNIEYGVVEESIGRTVI